MKYINNILYCLLVIVGLTSCFVEEVLENYPDKGNNDNSAAQIMLSLSIPDSQLPSNTRVMGESTVNSLWILEFENGFLKEKIDITAKYNNAKGSRLYVAIEETSYPVALSIVANTDVSMLAVGTAKDAVLRNLTFTNANELSYIPMYGESETFENINKDNTYDTTVELVRSIAKIEVQYNSTQADKEFTFLGIKVLNTNAEGYVPEGFDIPSQTSIASISSEPILVNNNLKTASVYIAETANNSKNKVQILVHGLYQGTDCWYRLDMIKNNEKDEITNLVRNHKYVFALQNVNFLGRTEADALTGDPDNKAFDARIMTLDAGEADILDITTDDEFFLGTNSSELQLTLNSEGLCFTKLKILTNNVSQGWKIVDAPEGVTFNPGMSGGTAASDEQRKVSTVWIYIDRNIIDYEFNFYVTTGKIRKTITVKILS